MGLYNRPPTRPSLERRAKAVQDIWPNLVRGPYALRRPPREAAIILIPHWIIFYLAERRIHSEKISIKPFAWPFLRYKIPPVPFRCTNGFRPLESIAYGRETTNGIALAFAVKATTNVLERETTGMHEHIEAMAHILADATDGFSVGSGGSSTLVQYIDKGAQLAAVVGSGVFIQKLWHASKSSDQNSSQEDRAKKMWNVAVNFAFFAGALIVGWRIASLSGKVFSDIFSGSAGSQEGGTLGALVNLAIQLGALGAVARFEWNVFKIYRKSEDQIEGKKFLNEAIILGLFEVAVIAASSFLSIGRNAVLEIF